MPAHAAMKASLKQLGNKKIMAYITLELAKKHLNVEESYTDDDSYIKLLIGASENAVSKDICENLKDIESEPGKLPDSLVFAILLQIGDYYSNRETMAFGCTVKALPTYDKLIGHYRNYSK